MGTTHQCTGDRGGCCLSPMSSLQFQRRRSLGQPFNTASPSMGWGAQLASHWVLGKGAGMWVCVTAWQELCAFPCAEMCLHNSSRCYLFLSRNIKTVHLLGLQKPSCKMHPKGQLSPLLLKSESRPGRWAPSSANVARLCWEVIAFPRGKEINAQSP